jgi:hypothetical protein
MGCRVMPHRVESHRLVDMGLNNITNLQLALGQVADVDEHIGFDFLRVLNFKVNTR